MSQALLCLTDRTWEFLWSVYSTQYSYLQVTSEQLMLVQANFVDQENQWKEEKQRLELKIRDATEKHEHELSEKDLQFQTLKSSLTELESAYSQSAAQYNALQVRIKCLCVGWEGHSLWWQELYQFYNWYCTGYVWLYVRPTRKFTLCFVE